MRPFETDINYDVHFRAGKYEIETPSIIGSRIIAIRKHSIYSNFLALLRQF